MLSYYAKNGLCDIKEEKNRRKKAMRAKKILASILAKLSVASAEKSAARPSRQGYYQPKEPEAIAKLRRK